MIEINNQYIKENILKMNKLLEDYQLTQANLFQQLNNSCISWQDGNSVVFDNLIKEEKKESEFFYSLLINRRNLFNSIYNYYNDIGNKIRCNLQNRSNSIKLADGCKNSCSSVMNEMNNINFDISVVRDNVNSAYNILNNAYNKIVKYYDRVREIENSILVLIRKIDDILVKEFEFSYAVISHDKDNSLDFVGISKDIELTKLYSNDEVEDFKLIFGTFADLSADYKSSNTKELDASVDELRSAADLLIAKRQKYIEVLTTTFNNYKAGNKEANVLVSKDV